MDLGMMVKRGQISEAQAAEIERLLTIELIAEDVLAATPERMPYARAALRYALDAAPARKD